MNIVNTLRKKLGLSLDKCAELINAPKSSVQRACDSEKDPVALKLFVALQKLERKENEKPTHHHLPRRLD